MGKHFGIVFTILLYACTKSVDPIPGPHDDIYPKEKTKSDALQSISHYEHCVRQEKQVSTPTKPLTLAGIDFVSRGTLLVPSRSSSPPRHHWTLGILADTKEDLPNTLTQLDHLKTLFQESQVEAIIVLGGIGSSYEAIRAILGRLRGSVPVFALPGDRESRSGFQAAVEAWAPSVVDLSRIRAIVAPGVSMMGVPGYFLFHQLWAKEQGCCYDKEDIQELMELAKSLPAPRILFSHGPPQGEGPQAIDRAFGDINAGDPLLLQLMRSSPIRFGCFAHFHESAGKATTLEGKPVPEMTWSSSLLLNVGAADSIAHEDLTGKWSHGTAAIFELKKEKARFKLLSLPQP